MNQTINPEKCTGCKACFFLCPNKCIIMDSDREGFFAPSINEKTCNDCEICKKRCPQNYRQEFTNNNCIKVYGVKYKNIELRTKSASGGVFAGIAKNILGVSESAVFGCVFDSEIVAKHICITHI
jgi:NAD-dependent dihydropyrimidine dehydrogenase PreA subunit